GGPRPGRFAWPEARDIRARRRRGHHGGGGPGSHRPDSGAGRAEKKLTGTREQRPTSSPAVSRSRVPAIPRSRYFARTADGRFLCTIRARRRTPSSISGSEGNEKFSRMALLPPPSALNPAPATLATHSTTSSGQNRSVSIPY